MIFSYLINCIVRSGQAVESQVFCSYNMILLGSFIFGALLSGKKTYAILKEKVKSKR